MKTQINYSVSQNGNNYNGSFFRRSNLKRETVIRHALAHAEKMGFVGAQIHVTATGCAQPMLNETILA